MTAAVAVDVSLAGLDPLVFVGSPHVATGVAVYMFDSSRVSLPACVSASTPVTVSVVTSPGMIRPTASAIGTSVTCADDPMFAVPVMAAVLVVVMPARQGEELRTVPIVVMAVVARADMHNPACARDMPRSAVIIVVRVGIEPAARENKHGRQRRRQ